MGGGFPIKHIEPNTKPFHCKCELRSTESSAVNIIAYHNMFMTIDRFAHLLATLCLLMPLMLCDRIQDKMYATIFGSICFRRLNGTHSTGCGSTLGGSVGVLHLIETVSDFQFVWTDNKPPAPPYTLIIPPALFTRENILDVTYRANGNIAGIVLIENKTNVVSFSQELKCPNANSGLADQTCDANQANSTWNPFGTGLLHENFPFPIIYVKDEEKVRNLTECYHKFNANDKKNQHTRRLCSIQIKSFMSAAVNSAVCTRRTRYMNNMNPQRYCDPMQSKNIYATLFARPIDERAETEADAEHRSKRSTDKTDEEFIMVAARIDTTSMFDGIGLGAMDSIVPAVTLMSTAHTLSKLLDTGTKSKLNVLFMLFNGEAYDYIGSQRFVYDAEKGDFPMASTQTAPIHLENIKLFIDIGSLDNPTATTIYQLKKSAEADKLFNTFQSYGKLLGIDVNQTVATNLPPTSAQTFLRHNQSFPAVIFYSNANKNRFYHSIYDNEQNIGFVYQNTTLDFTTLINLAESTSISSNAIQMAIRNYSSALSFSLYERIEGKKYEGDLGANPYLIDEMLFCYLVSAKCPLFQATVKDPNALVVQPLPPQRYVSVQGSLSYETVGWTYRLLGFVTGRPEPSATKENCTVFPLTWVAGYHGNGECLRTTQNLSYALSPAFSIDNYEWSSGKYSTWTESTWSEINIRIFLKPAVSQEALTLAIGLVVMLISFVMVFVINSKSDVLFGESTSSINVLTLPSQC